MVLLKKKLAQKIGYYVLIDEKFMQFFLTIWSIFSILRELTSLKTTNERFSVFCSKSFLFIIRNWRLINKLNLINRLLILNRPIFQL